MPSRTLTLAVSGKLWNRSLVMIDTETKSLWSHLLGECMKGPLQGAKLQPIPAEMTTWKAWRNHHPQTTVLKMSRTSRRYSKEFYKQPERFWLGLLLSGQPYHASLATLKQRPVLNVADQQEPVVVTFDAGSTSTRVFLRRVGQQTLSFQVLPDGQMKDLQTGTVWNRISGVALSGPLAGKRLPAQVGIVSYRGPWKIFHPNSQPVEDSTDSLKSLR